MKYAFDHKIGYTLTRKVSPHAPSFSKPEKRRMIINMGWYNHAEIPFTIAHEIAHIENGDSGELYYSPGSFKHKYEREANLRALDIIMPIYLRVNDGIIPSNYQTIVEQLEIPQFMANDVRVQLIKLSMED